MPTLRFQGYSDDTFGEYGVTNDDFDNCASGDPIQFRIRAPSEPNKGLVVTGQFCPGRSGSWMVGVANDDPHCDDEELPAWNMRFEPSPDKGERYSPSLLIDVPEDFELTCLTRYEDS